MAVVQDAHRETLQMLVDIRNSDTMKRDDVDFSKIDVSEEFDAKPEY